MKNRKYLPLISTTTLLPLSIFVSSCSNSHAHTWKDDLKTFNEQDMANNNNEQEIINGYQDWFNSLSLNPWNHEVIDDPFNKGQKLNRNIDAIISSHRQAFELYCNEWGDFWNESLHKGEEPVDVERRFISDWLISTKTGFLPDKYYGYKKKFLINGGGYKFMENALNLSNAIAPTDIRLYHGVEYQEVEFYDQLKDFIKPSNEYPNQLDYSECVGQTITTNGFISTSTIYDKKNLTKFCLGENWTNNYNPEPPLKEPSLFIIDVKKDTKGLAWVSKPFAMVDLANDEHQVIINREKQFQIKKWEKRKDEYSNVINVFWMDLL